jgi:hypothetical protein
MVKDPKRAKSETLSLRMDPKTRFMLELLSRMRGQSITVVVERAIKEAAENEVVSCDTDEHGNEESKRNWRDFWDAEEGVRTLKLLADPKYPSSFEEDEIRAFTKTHWDFFYASEKAAIVREGYTSILWPKIQEYLKIWREKRSADYWAAGNAMKADLGLANVQAPEWPRKTKATKGFSRDLDDEIPF